jgi:hypothetical protein
MAVVGRMRKNRKKLDAELFVPRREDSETGRDTQTDTQSPKLQCTVPHSPHLELDGLAVGCWYCCLLLVGHTAHKLIAAVYFLLSACFGFR